MHGFATNENLTQNLFFDFFYNHYHRPCHPRYHCHFYHDHHHDHHDHHHRRRHHHHDHHNYRHHHHHHHHPLRVCRNIIAFMFITILIISKWKHLNLFNCTEKVMFDDVYSDNLDDVRNVVLHIEKVWDTRTNGSMRPWSFIYETVIYSYYLLTSTIIHTQ